MSIAEELRTEGAINASRKSLASFLEHATPALRARFEERVANADSLEALEELQAQILQSTQPLQEV